MKFYLDEHIDPVVGEILKDKRHEIIEARKQNPGISDKEHLEFAWEQKAIIVTRDDDFLKLIENESFSAGIIIVNKYYRPRELAEKIEDIVRSLHEVDIQNNTFFV